MPGVYLAPRRLTADLPWEGFDLLQDGPWQLDGAVALGQRAGGSQIFPKGQRWHALASASLADASARKKLSNTPDAIFLPNATPIEIILRAGQQRALNMLGQSGASCWRRTRLLPRSRRGLELLRHPEKLPADVDPAGLPEHAALWQQAGHPAGEGGRIPSPADLRLRIGNASAAWDRRLGTEEVPRQLAEASSALLGQLPDLGLIPSLLLLLRASRCGQAQGWETEVRMMPWRERGQDGRLISATQAERCAFLFVSRSPQRQALTPGPGAGEQSLRHGD